MSIGVLVSEKKSEVLQGTLDLMVLKTLYAMRPQHGFGIARRIEQVSEGVLDLNEGTVYTALLRLQQRGWIASRWGDQREQPEGAVLLDYEAGYEATGARDGKLGTSSGCDGACNAAGEAGVRRCGDCGCCGHE
jgi:hypothetical protein